MKITTMRRIVVLFFCMAMTCAFTKATEVYVDARNGCDGNAGTADAPVKTISGAYSLLRDEKGIERVDDTVYLYPGTYLVEKPIFLMPPREASDAMLTIQAVKLPGENGWKPEDMPVILSGCRQGELGIPGFEVFTAVFFVQRDNVTIRGLKFFGYPQPNSRFIPIARFQGELDNLKVEQCLFVGDRDFPIQVGVLADGGGIQVSHCVFHNAKNSVVFWRKAGQEAKKGNRFTHSIVYGAYQSGMWTAFEDEDLVFKNNVITKCKHAWISNEANQSSYTAENCVIVDNEYEQARASYEGIYPADFDLKSINVKREGMLEFVTMGEVDEPVPYRYLHLTKDSPGSELQAGLFVGN